VHGCSAFPHARWSERVLGALAPALGEAMDDPPSYAKSEIARELRGVLTELARAELSPANLSLLEGVDL
jgi:hypothetical protein